MTGSSVWKASPDFRKESEIQTGFRELPDELLREERRPWKTSTQDSLPIYSTNMFMP